MKIFTVFMLFLFAITTWAQPSLADSKRHVKKLKPYKVKWAGKITKNIRLNEWAFYRGATLTFKLKKHRGITYKQMIQVEYKKIGNGKWNFDRIGYYGDPVFFGLKRPKTKDLIKFIKSNLRSFIPSSDFQKVVGEIKNIKLSKKPEWKWATLKRLDGYFEVDYSVKEGNLTVVDYHKKLRVRFRRDTIIKGPFTSLDTSVKDSKKIGKKKYTQEEYDKIKSIGEAILEKEIHDIVSKLPDVKVPNFKLYDEFIYFVHDKMLNGSEAEVRSLLYYNLSKRYFMKKPEFHFTSLGAKLLDGIMGFREQYSKSFCKYPKIKDRLGQEITFYGKENRLVSKISVGWDPNEKSWKIIDIKMHYEDNVPDYGMKQRKMGNFTNPTECDDKPTIIQPLPIYKVGDTVSYQFKDSIHYGTVIKKDSLPGRYQIKFPTTRTIWGNAKLMKKVDPSKVPEVTVFEKGDTVKVKFDNGSYIGTVLRVDNRKKKLFVDFTDIQDAWVTQKSSVKTNEKVKTKASAVKFKVGDKVRVKFRTKSFNGIVKKIDNRNKKIFVDFKVIKDMWVYQVHSTIIK